MPNVAFLILLVIVTFNPNVVGAVIDRCPSGECGGGSISLWFWIALAVWILGAILFKLVWGNGAEKVESKNALIVISKLVFLFVGIPTALFFVFGGKDGNGGEAAIGSFFALILVFSFTEKLPKWAMGEDSEKKE